jgi:hypothetical protein
VSTCSESSGNGDGDDCENSSKPWHAHTTCTPFGSNYEYLFRTPSMCQLLSGCDNSYKVYAIDEHIEVYLANIINNNIKLATWFIIACLLMTDY